LSRERDRHLTRELVKYVSGLGVSVVGTRIPTEEMRNSKFFELLQRQGRTDLVDPVAFELEYMVDRIQHCRTFIEPALRNGAWVICDRYALSSIGSLLLRLPALKDVAISAISKDAWFRDLCKYLVQPDISLLLHANPLTTAMRLRARPDEANQQIDIVEYGALQKLLLEIANAKDVLLIDTDRSAVQTLSECWPLIDKLNIDQGGGA
jgi:dTMP kinase